MIHSTPFWGWGDLASRIENSNIMVPTSKGRRRHIATISNDGRGRGVVGSHGDVKVRGRISEEDGKEGTRKSAKKGLQKRLF